MTQVSIIIPTLNAGPRFGELLQRLQSQRGGVAIEIIVIDSESADDTVAIAGRGGAAVQTIRRAEFNHGRTRNLAITRSSGDLLVMLSQDAFPRDEFLIARLAENFADDGVAGAFARHEPDPTHPPLVQRAVRAWCGSPERRETAFANWSEYERLLPAERMRACRFDNVCSMIRRSAWEVFPFAAREFAEDLEWAQRVLKAGGKIVYEPRAVVVHSHAHTLGEHYIRTLRTHRALWELFGWRQMRHPGQVPRAAWRHAMDEFCWLRSQPLGVRERWGGYATIPARAMCTSLAIFRGGAKAAQVASAESAGASPSYLSASARL